MHTFLTLNSWIAATLISFSSYSAAKPSVLDPGFISIMNEEEQSETLFKMILDTSLLNYSAVQVQSGNFVKCLAKKMEGLNVVQKENSYELKFQAQLDASSCDDASMGISKLSLDINTTIKCSKGNDVELNEKSLKWEAFKDSVLKSEICSADDSSTLDLSHNNTLQYEFVLDEAHPDQLAVVKNKVVISSDDSSACQWQVKDLETKKWIQTPGNICKYSQETILDASKVERINYFKKTEMNFEIENSLINFETKKLVTEKTVVLDSKISNSNGI